MAAHYGIAMIPNANKNAMNVLYALWVGEDPTQSQNLSQPANATGSINDPTTYWFGGRLYSDAELLVIQNFASNIPAETWPIAGVSGSVTLADVQAAATALIFSVTTQDTYTSQEAAQTLNALLTAMSLQRVVDNNV